MVAFNYLLSYFTNLFLICYSVLVLYTHTTEGALKRCFVCRSRGDLGSCKDPFKYNNTSALEDVKGISSVPCASGWCSKILEGGANEFKDEEYGAATERRCLQRGPADNEERCALTTWGRNPVPIMMCICQGDLCNGAHPVKQISTLLSLPVAVAVYFNLRI